jgi:hypothetical protein
MKIINMKSFILVYTSLLFFGACVKPQIYPVEPVLTFSGLSRNYLVQGASNTDSLLVQFKFTDGDGDIGSEDSLSLFFTDLRTGVVDPVYSLPRVPDEGAANGINGKISVVLFNTCCVFTDGTPPCQVSPSMATDSLRYQVILRDRAGHSSAPVLLPSIMLYCD